MSPKSLLPTHAAGAAAGLAALLAALTACQLPSVNLATNDPIKVDIAMRLDVYQHNSAAGAAKPGGDPAAVTRPTPGATPASGAPRTAAEIAERAKNRQADIQVFKNSRLIGEARTALLAIITEPAGDYGDYVRRTVAAENNDRMAQMKAAAEKQKRPLPEVQTEQAALWVNRSFKGEWIETRQADGSYQWTQKKADPHAPTLPRPAPPRRPLRARPLLLAALLLAAPARAATPGDPATLDLTYRTAIERALAKNFQIQVEAYNPRIAKSRTTSQEGRFDPTIDLSTTYSENRRDLRALNPDFDSDDPVGGDSGRFAQSSGLDADATISGVTPWGLNYSVGPSITRNTDSQAAFNETYNTFVGGSITQPLLRGFGTDVNLAAVRISRTDQSISAWSLRQRVIDVVTDVIGVYNDLFFSIQNLGVERRSRALALQTLRDNERRAEIGVMTELDIVQAQADVAERDGRVLIAERAVADNENFLKQLVTDDVTGVLRTAVRIAPPSFDLDLAVDETADLRRAFDLRPDYQQALLDLQRRNINVVFTRNQTLPQLDLVASLGLNGLDTTALGSVGEVGAPSNFGVTVGGVFSLPIPNRTARGNLEVARLEIARQLVALKQLEQSITIEVDNAAGQIRTTRKLIDANRAARDFAERTLEAAQARLSAGTATTFEVLQFQRDLATAEINEIGALTGYQKAIADYARRTGSTLERNRLRLE